MSLCIVTGATGFIGSQLVKKLLENGESVRCLVRASSNTDRLNGLDVELRQTDFSDSDSLKRGIQGSDTVYHCAGCITTLHEEEMFQTNCENTKRLAQACMNSDSAPKFIYVSSLAAGGPMPGKDAPLREEWMTENPVSVYGKSKLAAEMELRKLSSNLPISIVRPPMVLGSGDKYSEDDSGDSGYRFPLLSRLGEKTLYGSLFRRRCPNAYFGGGKRNSLTDCTESGNPDNSYQSGIYYVARDRNPEYGELGELIGKKLGRKWTIAWHFARPVFWMICTVANVVNRMRGRPSIVNRDKAAEALAGNWICSDKKAKKELGFVADGDLSGHLDAIIADFRARGLLK